MILRVLFPLQLLGIPKHALALHVSPAHMFRSSFNNLKVLLRPPTATLQALQQQRTSKRTAKALAATARGSAGSARATDSTGIIESSNAFFLGNDGQWIDYDETFKHSRGNKFKGQDDSKYLRKLTVKQLRQEARERGQTSTGSREALLERLVSKHSPGKGA